MRRDPPGFRPTAFAAAALLLGAFPTPGFSGLRLGENLRVNTYTPSDQYAPDVARDALGNFVVVWASAGQDGDGDGIFGQRYAADGRPLGGEFRVNTKTNGEQQYPRVAMAAAGNFVIVWSGPDGDDLGVHLRRYDAQGHAQGGQSRVNVDLAHVQVRPDVGMDAAGNFTVVWATATASDFNVFQRRYGADGTPLGDGGRVNVVKTHYQDYPVIAMDATGDYVVAWETDTVDGQTYTVFYRRFDAAGTPKDAGDVHVAVTSGGQQRPAAAMDASGDFVIAWSDVYSSPHEHAIHARRFAANGAAIDADPLTVTTDAQYLLPWGLSMDATGDVVTTWRVAGSGASDVLFRLLGSDGEFKSGVLRANTNRTKYHESPSVSMDADGDFVIVWNAGAAGAYDHNVLLQRYRYLDQVNVGIGQVDGPDPATTGDQVHYTLKVSNLRAPSDLGLPDSVQGAIGAATGVTIVDTLPATATFVSATGLGWTCTFASPEVTCDSRRAALPGNRMEPVTLTVTAPNAAGTLTNHAVVSADQNDGNLANNVSDEDTTVH